MSTNSAMPVVVAGNVVGVDEIRAAISYWMKKKPCMDGFSLSREASKLADVYGEMIATGEDAVARESVNAETLRYLAEALGNSSVLEH